MSSAENLRELINQRLTAAAEEIFSEFEKTIVQYEEEIDRQRRLLDISWKPAGTFHTADLRQQHVHEENVTSEHPQVKKEQEEPCTSQDGEQVVLMQEADMLVHCKSRCEEISREMFQSNEEISHQRRLLDIIWKPQIRLHRIDFPQQHVCKQKGLNHWQLCNQERNFSVDQEDPESLQIKDEQEKLCTSLDKADPEPSQIKEEQEELCTSLAQEDPEPPQIKPEQDELCISQQGEQIIVKQATDTFLLTSTDEDSDHSELEPNSDQLLSYNSPVTESPHEEGTKHVDSGSTQNATLKTKIHTTNSSHSNNVDNSSLSQSHCDTDTGRKSVNCDVCGKTFKNKHQIMKHHQIHKGVKPYACNAFGKHFNCSQKPYSCKRCGKSFRQSAHLTVHMRIHTGEKPYFCEPCGKSFRKRYHLTVHMRTHTGEKPYFCETCGKSFRTSDHLTVHMRSHSGQKPYSCETCGKNFSSSGYLTIHMRTHTGKKPYSCERCGKSFIQGSILTDHMRTHTGEKPFSCKICGKSFRQRSHLSRHMRTLHSL